MLFVPREQNRWADWLSKVGAKVDSPRTVEELGVELAEHACPPKLQAHTSVVGHGKQCRVCRQELTSRGV